MHCAWPSQKNTDPRSLHSNDGCFDDFLYMVSWFLAKNWLKLCQKVAAKEFHHNLLALVETSWTCSLGAASIDWIVPWKTWGNDAKPNRQQQTPNNTSHSNTWSTLHLQALCGLPCKQPFLCPSCDLLTCWHFFLGESNGKNCKKYVKICSLFALVIFQSLHVSPALQNLQYSVIQHTKKKSHPAWHVFSTILPEQRILDDKNRCARKLSSRLSSAECDHSGSKWWLKVR